jgi:hypothetical protein
MAALRSPAEFAADFIKKSRAAAIASSIVFCCRDENGVGHSVLLDEA